MHLATQGAQLLPATTYPSAQLVQTLALREQARQKEATHLTHVLAENPKPVAQAVQFIAVLEQRVQLAAQGTHTLPAKTEP